MLSALLFSNQTSILRTIDRYTACYARLGGHDNVCSGTPLAALRPTVAVAQLAVLAVVQLAARGGACLVLTTAVYLPLVAALLH